MTKPELGTKRLCARCGARFYDLVRTPITCPKCETVFVPANLPSRFEREPEPVREAGQPVDEPEFLPLKDADAETDDEQGVAVVPEVEDDYVHQAILIDDNNPDDCDLVEIVCDDVDTAEEN
jgi:uncharacterized protein (TIGR02300 family)